LNIKGFILPMRHLYSLLLTSCSLVFLSCHSYRPYKSKYTFRSETGAPDYSSLDYWAAHPRKWDPADSIPASLSAIQADSAADVFFIHPTTLTHKTGRKDRNARIDDWLINAKTDYTSILYQASVFNQHCRVFAPRYRQAHIRNFFSRDSLQRAAAFRLAYEDVKRAFQYYLEHFNHGRPIIIAGHSQGSMLGITLLKEFFDLPEMQDRLVVAYLPGWPIPLTAFNGLKVCADSLQTGCVCGWQTLRKGFIPSYYRNKSTAGLATNPLSWDTLGSPVSRDRNLGSVLTKFNKIYPRTTNAQLVDGLLFVKKPRFPWSFLFFRRNYHVADINLFYLNIRQNVGQRIRAFLER